MIVYDHLISGSVECDPFDRHVLACAIAVAALDQARPLAVGLGLGRPMLEGMAARYFPHATALLEGRGDGSAPLGPEEPDLRGLLMEHGTRGAPEEEWLARIVARRAMEPNHLWQDLGLTGRSDLGLLMRRHFAPLAQKNDRDMKWKKFFYRQLCGMEGIQICKSPICDSCTDFAECFGGEDGMSLLAQGTRGAGLRCLAAGMDGCVPKPVVPAPLFGEIGRVLAEATG